MNWYLFFSILGLCATISGNLLINYRRKIGFVVWTLGDIFWIAVNIIGTLNVPMVMMYVLYIIINIDGWIKWSKIKTGH